MGWKEDVAEAKSLMAQVRELNKAGADGKSGIDSGEKSAEAHAKVAKAMELAEKAKADRKSEQDGKRLGDLLDNFEKNFGVDADPSILDQHKTGAADELDTIAPSAKSRLSMSKSLAETIYGKTGAAKLQSAKVLNEGDDTAGGFLVVPEYHQELFAEVRRTGNALRTLGWVSLHPTAKKQIKIPRGAGSATVGWTGELQPAPSQDQQFGQIVVDIDKLTGISKMSEEDFEDSDPAVMDLAITELGKLQAIAEEQAWLFGTGTLQPKGVITSYANSVITNNVHMDGTFDTQQEQIDAVLDLASKVLTTYFAPATGVLVSPRRYAFWRKAKDSTGNYLFNMPGTTRAPGEFSTNQYSGGDILGLPIGISANLPTTLNDSFTIGGGSQDCIIVADWSELHVFVRRDVTVTTNTTGDEAFDNGLVKVKLTMRQGATAERQPSAFAIGYGAGLV